MSKFMPFVILALVLCNNYRTIDGRRSGGRSSSWSKPSYSSRPSHYPSPSRPSPSSRPSPTRQPAFNPGYFHLPSHNPSPTHTSVSRPSSSHPSSVIHNPPAFSAPPGSFPSYHPPSSNTGTQRPLGFQLPGAPMGPPKNVPTTGNSQARPTSRPSSPSYNQPAFHPSSYHSPSHNPSPTHTSVSRPSPSQSSPIRHNPPAYSAPPGGYPSFHPPSTGTQRPLGFQVPGSNSNSPIGPPKNVATVGNSQGGSSNVRPIGFVPPGSPGHTNNGNSHPSQTGTGTQRPIGFVPPGSPGHSSSPIGPPKNVGTQGNAPPSYYGNPPAYNPAGYGPPAYTPHNPAGYGPPAYTPHNPGYGPPAYSPHYNPGGYGSPPAYSPGYGSGNYHAPGGVTIINQNYNNHHYNGYGGGYSYPSYHYTPVDTGSGSLGFFLGYSLGRLTTPSYHYHVGYSDYSYRSPPIYDHYEVHHYYHNSQNVPKEAEIQPNAIVGCFGDAGSFCPANTTSLCTNNGAVMCVASAMSTVPCSKEKQTNCVKTTIPCVNNTAPECANSQTNTTTLSVPCISTAKIYGNITYVNNTIVISNTSAVGVTTSSANSSSLSNGTISSTTTTTTVLPETTTVNTQMNVTNSTIVKRETTGPAPQSFCVTILALPAAKKPTEGEVVAESAKSIFTKFAVKALGID